MKLWVGDSFILSLPALSLMTVIYFIQMSQTTNMFLKAYGLFKDVWAPIAQAVLNVCLSIGLGCFWGISGVLMGILISQILIVKIWKPYFLYKEAFHGNFLEYLFLYTKKIILLLVVFGLTVVLSLNFSLPDDYGYTEWMAYAVFVSITYCFISALFFYVFDKSFRTVFHSIVERMFR